MSDLALRVEGISKRYRVGQREPYRALRDVLTNTLYSPFRRLTRRSPSALHHSSSDLIWALKDVSFEVKRGEVVGIIGRNGAGKTTLLKILSRITEPTEGYAEVGGRVGSLLEVGTGFHPELTGRENIYLNGAILGMKKTEIDRKFDEIVAFAETEKFIDTPVKYYSTGMQMRLAFAVAAHVEPEILLVDEVLTVGDIAFQKKCLGKMGDVSKEGRTVLFVSHHMGAVTRLCQQGIWLEKGQLYESGKAEEIVSAYLHFGGVMGSERRWDNLECAPGGKHLRLRAVHILDCSGEHASSLDIRFPFYIEIEYVVLQLLSSVRVCIRIVAVDGTIIFQSCDNSDPAWEGKPRYPGVYKSRCQVPGNFLNEGQYAITVTADIPFIQTLLVEESLLSFHVEQTGGVNGRFPEKWPGLICPALEWKVQRVGS